MEDEYIEMRLQQAIIANHLQNVSAKIPVKLDEVALCRELNLSRDELRSRINRLRVFLKIV